MGDTPCVKSLRSSYTGLYPQTGHPSRGCIPRSPLLGIRLPQGLMQRPTVGFSHRKALSAQHAGPSDLATKSCEYSQEGPFLPRDGAFL